MGNKEVPAVLDFRNLRVWQDAMELAERIYAFSSTFPSDERFGIASQMRRAAVSVPSCIAEGNARGSTRDYLRFLSMSSGSLAELETQTLLAARLGFVPNDNLDECVAAIHSVARQLQALRKALKTRLTSAESPFPVSHSPFPA
jgi:four helix bundle protein